jgi:subtilisin-like proprotein convertase family protein
VRGRRRRIALAGVLGLALTICVTPSTAVGAKKKGKGNATVFTKQLPVNGGIPDAVANTVTVPLASTITVPKKFKGKVVKDVNVTAVQTTGTMANSAGSLTATLLSPSGRRVDLFAVLGGQSIGPFTIDDDTLTGVCNSADPVAAPCADGTRTLYQPFAGTANTIWNFGGGFPTNGPLASFDGLKMKGNWTLVIRDNSNVNGTSVLNQWGLRITGKPG